MTWEEENKFIVSKERRARLGSARYLVSKGLDLYHSREVSMLWGSFMRIVGQGGKGVTPLPLHCCRYWYLSRRGENALFSWKGSGTAIRQSR
jgi:hypothetical protein